jgi:hypothetical protein
MSVVADQLADTFCRIELEHLSLDPCLEFCKEHGFAAVIVVAKTLVSSRGETAEPRFLIPSDPAMTVDVSTAAKPSRSDVQDTLHSTIGKSHCADCGSGYEWPFAINGARLGCHGPAGRIVRRGAGRALRSFA